MMRSTSAYPSMSNRQCFKYTAIVMVSPPVSLRRLQKRSTHHQMVIEAIIIVGDECSTCSARHDDASMYYETGCREVKTGLYGAGANHEYGKAVESR